MKILLPVVFPVFVSASDKVYRVFNTLGGVSFRKKSDGFCGVFFGGDIDMNYSLISVLFKKLFIYNVNMGNLPSLLFEV